MCWDQKYLLLCKGCLDEYMYLEGEINLDSWYLPLGDFQTIFDDVNQRVAYWMEMYERAYKGEFRSSTPTTKKEMD